MQERQLIKKIKELRQIKPDQDWVLFNKRKILGEALEKSETSPFSILFAPIPIRKPVFIVAPLILVAAVLGGVFVYFNFLPQAQTPIVTQALDDQRPEKIVVSLEQLQASLEKVTLGLNDLKNAKDPNQALVMTEIIKATAKNIGDKIDQIGINNSGYSEQVLGVKIASQGLAKAVGNTQVEMIEDQIEDFRQRTLTEEDQVRLQKAEEYYNEGKYTEAMFLIQRIGNN